MENINNLTNTQLQQLMKDLEQEYNNIKNTLLISFDRMVEIEKKYEKIINLLNTRLK